jgi:polysaccharide export outer membrane protein
MNRALVLLVALLGACVSSRSGYDYSREPDPRKTEYVIGVADRLAIQVWKNPDLSTEAVVRPDGTITMPLVGDLTANGRTPTQLKGEIARQLARYLKNEGAVVTVAVTAVNSYSFTVSGNVMTPGVFNAQKYVTVLDAVQLAGGPNRFAAPSETQLTRRDKDGRTRLIPINYPAIVDGSQPEANLAVLAGDRIHVP